MHFDHFLKGWNNVNSRLKLKRDFSSQILDSKRDLSSQTLSTSNVNIEILNIQSKGLVIKYTRKSRDVSKS